MANRYDSDPFSNQGMRNAKSSNAAVASKAQQAQVRAVASDVDAVERSRADKAMDAVSQPANFGHAPGNPDPHMAKLMDAAAADQAKLYKHHVAHRDADMAFHHVHNGRPIDSAGMHNHMTARVVGKAGSHTGNYSYAPEDVQGGDPGSDDSDAY